MFRTDAALVSQTGKLGYSFFAVQRTGSFVINLEFMPIAEIKFEVEAGKSFVVYLIDLYLVTLKVRVWVVLPAGSEEFKRRNGVLGISFLRIGKAETVHVVVKPAQGVNDYLGE